LADWLRRTYPRLSRILVLPRQNLRTEHTLPLLLLELWHKTARQERAVGGLESGLCKGLADRVTLLYLCLQTQRANVLSAEVITNGS